MMYYEHKIRLACGSGHFIVAIMILDLFDEPFQLF
jgi:hypothetical protein